LSCELGFLFRTCCVVLYCVDELVWILFFFIVVVACL
jgi:hypothetical protein